MCLRDLWCRSQWMETMAQSMVVPQLCQTSCYLPTASAPQVAASDLRRCLSNGHRGQSTQGNGSHSHSHQYWHSRGWCSTASVRHSCYCSINRATNSYSYIDNTIYERRSE